ncbi:MAG: DUF4190 domain-containing protein [Candidatus Scatosoma sp.]
MYCSKCGKEILDEAYMCPHCGTMVRDLPKEVAAGDGTARGGNGADNGYRKTNAFAIAGFVCSFLFALLGLIFSIIAMKQCRERNEEGYGLAKAGMIISIVSMALSVLLGIIYGAALASVLSYI